MLSFRRFLTEELLRQVDLQKAVRRSGVDPAVLSHAHRVMTVNDFLENPPPEAAGAYALGLSRAGGMTGVYFYITRALGLTDWPTAYRRAFGKRWSWDNVPDPGVTDKLLARLLDEDKYIVFFLPNDALAPSPDRRYTREEVEFFRRHPEHLARVIFVLGAYDMVDPQDYESLVARNRTKPQRNALAIDVLKNPAQHRKPGPPV